MTTEAVLKFFLALHSKENILKIIGKKTEINYCAISTYSSVKLFSVVLQHFDWKSDGLQSKLIDIYGQPNETADTVLTYSSE